MVPWVGLQFVIVVFPDHTHLLFIPHIRQRDIGLVLPVHPSICPSVFPTSAINK